MLLVTFFYHVFISAEEKCAVMCEVEYENKWENFLLMGWARETFMKTYCCFLQHFSGGNGVSQVE